MMVNKSNKNQNLKFRFPVFFLLLSFALDGCSPKIFDATGRGWTLGTFNRPENAKPVILPNPNSTFNDPMSGRIINWEANDTFNPAAAVKGDSIYVLYRAEDKSGVAIGERTSRIGLAATADGITMHRRSIPILFPADDGQKANEWTGGCEDPRVAKTADGTYVMLYTQWNKKVPRLAVATSKDLINWDKHGPAFQKAYGGRFKDLASKSASIITTIRGKEQVIVQLNGKYVMYWGERFINVATSDNLIDWTPSLGDDDNLEAIVRPRKGYFDSALTECGPPAVLTDNGIVLLYNGQNSTGADADKNYTERTYSAGQLLFDKNNPKKVLARLDKPFFVPEKSFEKSGQYPAGTVFLEGLVYFKQKWFLYYGCADSRVAVAIASANNM